jgi:hypothetical protein
LACALGRGVDRKLFVVGQHWRGPSAVSGATGQVVAFPHQRPAPATRDAATTDRLTRHPYRWSVGYRGALQDSPPSGVAVAMPLTCAAMRPMSLLLAAVAQRQFEQWLHHNVLVLSLRSRV